MTFVMAQRTALMVLMKRIAVSIHPRTCTISIWAISTPEHVQSLYGQVWVGSDEYQRGQQETDTMVNRNPLQPFVV